MGGHRNLLPWQVGRPSRKRGGLGSGQSGSVFGRILKLTYAADHGRGNKPVLTHVNGHSSDALHYRTRPNLTDYRSKSNEFVFFGRIRQCKVLCTF
jgi:hypothetical protein